jgi:hypothetical protein
MKLKIHIPNILFILLAVYSCGSRTEPKRSPGEPHSDSKCNAINHCLISYGFDYTSVKTVTYRIYKKGTDFKEFIKEYKSTMDRDFLAEEKPDSWNNKRKERSINIPKEINADVDFILITADSLEYRISEIESDWQQFYGNEYLGWGCDMKSYKVNGVKGNSNIHIFKPGYVFPK